MDSLDAELVTKLEDFSITISYLPTWANGMTKLIRDYFDSAIATFILQTHINQYAPSGRDHMLWLPEKNGFFTIRSAYRVLTNNELPVPPMFK